MNNEEQKRPKNPKNLHVHYLSYEDRALLTRVVEAVEKMASREIIKSGDLTISTPGEISGSSEIKK